TAAKRDQALRIPVRALRFRPDRIGAGTPDASAKEESAVYVLAPDGALRRVEVEAGIRDNQRAEVLNGDLHEGDPLVVGLRRGGADGATRSANERAAIRSRRIGFVFQNFNLLGRTTALENVALPMIYANVPFAEQHRRARELLAAVGLRGREHHLPSQLSGGQQ